MRNMLTILLLTAVTASAAVILWQSDLPDTTRSLQLCERVRHLKFDQESDTWVELRTPKKTIVVCDIPETTRELNIEGLQQPFVDSPLPNRMIDVDCYRYARMKSGALPTQMPDGFYCNIPVVVH